MADSSLLAGIPLPCEALLEKRLFFTAAAKTILEMEASKYQISISDVEVFSFPDISGANDSLKSLGGIFLQALEASGYKCRPSKDDPRITWLSANNRNIIMYFSASKKEASLYLGKAGKLPPFFSSIPDTSTNQSNPATSEKLTTENIKLAGNWGNLKGSKVSYQDGSTGYMVVSGQSTGFGLELKPDGTFLQTTVVTSGRPSYRIFVSTTGNYTVNGNQLIFFPQDRHYRKWENEIIMTDEHSLPGTYMVYWSISKNEITERECLYIRYQNEQENRELCRE
ncbi:MAG: hypothetical protein IH591_01205 [Bacteroidales bacterium]|nr:hypothetical protein [Bacteroidales bacterium]